MQTHISQIFPNALKLTAYIKKCGMTERWTYSILYTQ